MQIWAVPNAVYYYVKSFVDAEVAWVVTLLYWYSYAAVFAVQMLGAAKLVQFWDLTSIWPPFIFYLVTPILLLALNLAGIRVRVLVVAPPTTTRRAIDTLAGIRMDGNGVRYAEDGVGLRCDLHAVRHLYQE